MQNIFEIVNRSILEFGSLINIEGDDGDDGERAGERALDKIIANLFKNMVEAYIQRLCLVLMSQKSFKKKAKDAPLKFELIPKIFENHILKDGDKKKIQIKLKMGPEYLYFKHYQDERCIATQPWGIAQLKTVKIGQPTRPDDTAIIQCICGPSYRLKRIGQADRTSTGRDGWIHSSLSEQPSR